MDRICASHRFGAQTFLRSPVGDGRATRTTGVDFVLFDFVDRIAGYETYRYLE